VVIPKHFQHGIFLFLNSFSPNSKIRIGCTS
jgi:hypothetical protein